MYKLLLKYNLLNIIPFDDTFFYASKLPKKVNFSKELIALNYSKYSPYKNPNIISCVESDYLMLWFYRQDITSSILIPESYLAFRELKLNDLDSIYIIKDKNYKIIIIKNNQLLNAFSLDSMDDATIKLTMDEYQVFQKSEISEDEYKNILQKSKKNLNLKDFYKFHTLELDRKTLLNSLVEKLSYPLAVLIVFSILVSYIHESMLKSDIKDLETTYLLEKSKNRDIKSFIHKHNKEVKKYKAFADKELVFTGADEVLNSIYTIFKKDEKAYILDISVNADKVMLKIQTDINAVTFLNRLNELKYFKRVVIQNTYKPRDSMRIISYDIVVKKIKEL